MLEILIARYSGALRPSRGAPEYRCVPSSSSGPDSARAPTEAEGRQSEHEESPAYSPRDHRIIQAGTRTTGACATYPDRLKASNSRLVDSHRSGLVVPSMNTPET
jgi:hypothetical protein